MDNRASLIDLYTLQYVSRRPKNRIRSGINHSTRRRHILLCRFVRQVRSIVHRNQHNMGLLASRFHQRRQGLSNQVWIIRRKIGRPRLRLLRSETMLSHINCKYRNGQAARFCKKRFEGLSAVRTTSSVSNSHGIQQLCLLQQGLPTIVTRMVIRGDYRVHP